MAHAKKDVFRFLSFETLLVARCQSQEAFAWKYVKIGRVRICLLKPSEGWRRGKAFNVENLQGGLVHSR